ncbi:hypothetical protein [Aureimonas sp. SK2]|uniref:hypothetical protein n=1 Tax=Aureimonas sp. SK2 TaxID=3015992 RepID=UPI002443CA03|nr:hypothetical protein [Aureimonas sp. SK2]
MSTTDIIEAYEAGLITRGEAVEQGLVDTIDALYEKSARAPEWARRGRFASERRYAGR